MAHIADRVEHLFLIKDLNENDLPDFPILRAVFLAVKARGCSYARVDALGDLFDDLPQFDW